MKNRNTDSGDDWATPAYVYDALNRMYNFDFDPCPLHATFDGLKIEWGKRNFINPPYSRKLKEAFINKAVEENKKGKLCVMLLPLATPKIFFDVIWPNAEAIYLVQGRIFFKGVNTKGEYTEKTNGMHDSMIVEFGVRVMSKPVVDTIKFTKPDLKFLE